MENERAEYVQYKGCSILPKPTGGPDARWYGGYEIRARNGSPISTRSYIFPGFLYFDAAWNDSIEYAKIEIDNLIHSELIREEGA